MTDADTTTSRIPRFYERTLKERLALLVERGLLSDAARRHLEGGGGLDVQVADRMSENVVACHGLPLGVALNFRINQRDVLVPMAVEEPSVVAAASNAARFVRMTGGFGGEASDPIMTTQVQLDAVPDVEAAAERIRAARDRILAEGDLAIPGMVRRGGGCRDLEVRVLDVSEGMLVVHLYVDVGDAMGANLVDAVAERVAPHIQALAGGRMGLRILSNLPLRRRVRVWADVSTEVIGAELADGIVRASRFAEKDPFRAVTHNKGLMNGVDAVAVACGQDWRAIEAGAHAFAGLGDSYRPLATWVRTPAGIRGELDMPMAVGTVGGATSVHQGVAVAFELMGVRDARTLAIVMGAAGLATNLASLRALAGEGIQRGHMRLHGRKAGVGAQAGEADDPAVADVGRKGGAS
jgi:hydroxymethylglutaryl-CoA reductase